MKLRTILLLVLAAFFASYAAGQTRIQGLLTESETSPIGIDVSKPRFPWQLASTKRAVSQTAYRIEVADQLKQPVWDSGKVVSAESAQRLYHGKWLWRKQQHEFV